MAKKDGTSGCVEAMVREFCKKNYINFIDPAESFFAAERNGEEIYYDRFTAAGHRAFAEAFIRWLKNYKLASK